MAILQEAVRELGVAYDDYFVLSNILREDGSRVLDDPRADQPWRRNLVRVHWPMIEAYASTLRRFCNVFRKHCELTLSEKHARLLDDESQFATAERIKETLKLAYRLHELEGTPNFGDQHWANVRSAIQVRDRITHPNSAVDLEVSDEDWPGIHSGLAWVLSAFTEFFDLVNKKYAPVGTDDSGSQ